MIQLSDHTKLVNLVVGMTRGAGNFPTFLRNSGYDVDTISPSFLNSAGDRVDTDLIISSHRYVLVIECDDTGLTRDTISKLDQIGIDDIRNEFKHAVSNDDVEHEVVYVGLSSLETNLADLDIDSPAIIYDRQNYELSSKNGFGDEVLGRRFGSVTVRKIPSHFIPVLSGDHPALMAEKVYQKLCSETFEGGAKTNPTILAELIYEEWWDHMSGAEKDKIVEMISTTLSEFTSVSADSQMRKLENSDRQYYVNTSDAFMDRCQTAVQNIAEDDSYQGTFNRFK